MIMLLQYIPYSTLANINFSIISYVLVNTGQGN